LRAPALHFFLLGSLLWWASLIYADWQFRQVTAPGPAVTAQLEKDWQAKHGRQPDAAQRQAIFQSEIDRRVLFTEALRRQLHRRDTVVLRRLYDDARFLGIVAPKRQLIQAALELRLYEGDEVIRRRLLERMRAIGQMGVGEPTPLQLQERYAAEHSSWLAPPRLSFRQVFIRRGDEAQARAKRILAQLTPDTSQNTLSDVSDPFLAGMAFTSRNQTELSRVFGQSFSQSVFASTLQTGQWAGPFASAYGWHLLFIDHQAPATIASFEKVKTQLRRDWQSEHERAQLQLFISRLRQRYRVKPA
jgi:hypothetical protein